MVVEPFNSKYVNEYDEEWLFEYSSISTIGLVRGSDVDWVNYPVVEGYALGLVLGKDERSWLKSAWQEAYCSSKTKSLYWGLNTKFVKNHKYCYLTNNYCPLCLKQKQEFEVHHCIWSSDGGTDDSNNLLKICNTCHAILTRGCDAERVPKDLAAYHHQLMRFGVEFIPCNPVPKGRHRGRSYLEYHPEMREALDIFYSLPQQKQKKWNRNWKIVSRIAYQYFRDMEIGQWSWEQHISGKITVIPWDFRVASWTSEPDKLGIE